MKMAMFSDIHGNLTALEAVLADIAAVTDIDLVWVLGDLAAHGPHPVECIRKIREVGEVYGQEKFKVIGGNTDRYLVTGERFRMKPAEDEEAFKMLHAGRVVADAIFNWGLERLSWEDYEYLAKLLGREVAHTVDGFGTVIGYHAVPGDDEVMLRPDTSEEEALDHLLDREGRLAIGGHIHVQMDRQIGRWRILNCGSVGLSFDMRGKAQWCLLSFQDRQVEVEMRALDYDVNKVLEDAQALGYPALSWLATRFGKE